MSNYDPFTPTGICDRCDENDATVKWGDVMTINHGGGQNYCERCAIEERVYHARARAKELAKLEAKLVELGGPAKYVRCDGWFLHMTNLGPGYGIQELQMPGCNRRKGHTGEHSLEKDK